MRRRSSNILVVLLANLFSFSAAAQELPVIAANDNRTSAGELRDGVLHLQLELRKGIWYPESEQGESIPSYAFAEVGKPLQVPGPTIRVPKGTAVDISLTNPLQVPATLHGFYERPGKDADGVVTIQPGETRNFRFDSGAPGVYLYWARTPDGKSDRGRVLDALLGAQPNVTYDAAFKKLRRELARFDKVLVPEMNDGQLTTLLRANLRVEPVPFTKVTGQPFLIRELVEEIESLRGEAS